MNFRIFSVKGKNPKTNRQKTFTITLAETTPPTEENILLRLQGELVAPLEWTEIPHDPPTEAQLSYARDLGILVPKSATKWDVSALLDKCLTKDSDPNPELLLFADGWKLEFSEYIGKKALYNLIFSGLPNRDRIAFFCFSIYRYLTEDRHANLDTSPHRELFYSFADAHENDAKFLDKLNGYSGKDLRFFGKLKIETDNGSFTASGGDTQNYAYKTAKKFLAAHFDIPDSNSKTIAGTRDSKNKEANSGNFIQCDESAISASKSAKTQEEPDFADDIPVDVESFIVTEKSPGDPSVPPPKETTAKDMAIGCGCLVIIVFAAFLLIGYLFADKEASEPTETPPPATSEPEG